MEITAITRPCYMQEAESVSSSTSNVVLCCSRDMVKLWTVAGKRYMAGRHELAEVQGPDYSLYDDFPEELDEV